jgi:DNA-binding PadR family transcriptional regulator
LISKELQALMETPLWIIGRLQPDDITFLTLIQNEGIKSNEWVNRTKRFIPALKRCKARGLVTPFKRKTAYYYDLTEQGLAVLKQLSMPLSPQIASS